MKVQIEFDCDNAAFEDDFGTELRAILDQAGIKIILQRDRPVATVCNAPEAADKLLDSNGTTIGHVKVTLDPPPVEDPCPHDDQLPREVCEYCQHGGCASCGEPNNRCICNGPNEHP